MGVFTMARKNFYKTYAFNKLDFPFVFDDDDDDDDELFYGMVNRRKAFNLFSS